MCEGVILERSVIGLLLAGEVSRFDKEARQSLDDASFLLVVELLPQARLRDRDVEEVQMQLGHGSPGLDPMLPAHRRGGAEEHRPGYGDGASLPASRRGGDTEEGRRWGRSPSIPQGLATYFRPAE